MKKIINVVCSLFHRCKAFSMIEAILFMLTVTILTASLAPVITKKLTNSYSVSQSETTNEVNSSCEVEGCNPSFCEGKKCYKAADGYYLNDEKISIKCEIGYACRNGKRYKCGNKTYTNGTGQKNCELQKTLIANCMYYSTTKEGKCVKCYLGYYINNGSCNPCENGYYANEIGLTECKKHVEIANCLKYSTTKANTCIECSEGYNLSSGSCVE